MVYECAMLLLLGVIGNRSRPSRILIIKVNHARTKRKAISNTCSRFHARFYFQKKLHGVESINRSCAHPLPFSAPISMHFFSCQCIIFVPKVSAEMRCHDAASKVPRVYT